MCSYVGAAIFADGASAMIIGGTSSNNTEKAYFDIVRFETLNIEDSLSAMYWKGLYINKLPTFC